MKKRILFLMVLVSALFLTTSAFAVGTGGATNKVPAATLIVPFFEVGINQAEDPLDTLLVVTNTGNGQIIHWHVWDIDGTSMALYGNETLDSAATWAASMRALIGGASSSIKSQLTEGDYYRGFVTIDIVTEATSYAPTHASYPFDDVNLLEGYIYYVRLLQGSSNGLNMIPIEHVGSSVDMYLKDFYQTGDGREEIDGYARRCLQNLSNGESCTISSSQAEMTIDSRVFLDPSYWADSRIIVFTWIPGEVGGPSIYCATHSCDSTYGYSRFNESGTEVASSDITLDHVVNVIDVSGNVNGWVEIRDVPGVFQIFPFSFNSANSGDASKNWDAIFESNLYY